MQFTLAVDCYGGLQTSGGIEHMKKITLLVLIGLALMSSAACQTSTSTDASGNLSEVSATELAPTDTPLESAGAPTAVPPSEVPPTPTAPPTAAPPTEAPPTAEPTPTPIVDLEPDDFAGKWAGRVRYSDAPNQFNLVTYEIPTGCEAGGDCGTAYIRDIPCEFGLELVRIGGSTFFYRFASYLAGDEACEGAVGTGGTLILQPDGKLMRRHSLGGYSVFGPLTKSED